MTIDEIIARNKKIAELYSTGEYSLKQLGEMFDLSLEGVRQLLIKRGVPINPKYKRLKRKTA